MTRTTTRRKRAKLPPASTIRAAAYLRQSVSDDLEFNSLDAQHEAIRSYVASQKAEGWILLPEDYRDSGFSGGTMDRPAFTRMHEDVRSGKIDIVIVHRIDRLSRSLSDFSRIIQLFQEHNVSLVSVTQQFNTASSMGQLTLNILMSFAQFERQMIAERTRDKMAATRKRGQWTGGRPVLGYNLVDKRLVINTAEAERVQEIFRLYLDFGSLIAVAAEANQHDWRTKTHTTKVGKVLQGRVFDKHAVRRILSQPIYLGKVHYDGQLHDGEHDAIIDEQTWAAAQKLLKRNGQNRNGSGCGNGNAILKGLVRCGVCGSAMVPNSTTKRRRRYTYYTCLRIQKQGASACPGSRISSRELEGAVVDRFRAIGHDPTLVSATIEAAKAAQAGRKPDLVSELRRLENEKRRLESERKNLTDTIAGGGSGISSLTDRLRESEDELSRLSNRIQDLSAEIRDIDDRVVDEHELRDALAAFDELWNAMTCSEQSRVLWLLVESITYGGRKGEVTIQFRPSGIRCLADGDGGTP